ncbi:MAG: choice-of-anchor A family protein [Spirochaetales bacterium]|nr:choice-of-anchor A family protein [Spirochaetales bacterium]
MKKNSIALLILAVLVAFTGCNLDSTSLAKSETAGLTHKSGITSKAFGDSSDYCIDLGVAANYTLFLKDSLVQSYVDSLGMIAAGGNVSLMDYGVALNTTANNVDSLVAGGRLDFQRGTVYHGNVVYGVPGVLNFTLLNGTRRQGQSIDFNAAFNYLENLSAELAALPTNANVVNNYNSLIFTGTNPGLNVFSVAASVIHSCYQFDISIPAGAKALINIVGGGSLTIQYKGITNNMNIHSRDILFNMPGFSHLTIQGLSLKGTVLAPRASIDFNNGNVDGSIIGYSLTGNGESHYFPFNPGCVPTEIPTPTPTPTPEITETPTPEITETPSPSPPPACSPQIFNVIPKKGTVGNVIIIEGNCFGGTTGIVKIDRTKTHILSWSNAEIKVEIVESLVPGLHSMTVILENVGYYYPQIFEITAPELEIINPIIASAGDSIILTGMYFGSNVSLFNIILRSKADPTFEFLASVNAWEMDSISGISSCHITLPQSLPAGEYLILANNIVGSSEAYDGLMIQ